MQTRCAAYFFMLSANEKGAYQRPGWRQIIPSAAKPQKIGAGLGYLILWLLPILPFNTLHLVLQTELQLFKSHFFEFFVVGEIAFFGE